MKLWIDGDGCPVVYESIQIAKQHHLECCIVCDTNHMYQYDVELYVVGKGKDSADFALVNRIKKQDIIVTQDYGLASMCLAKQAYVINQDGFLYTQENINALLMSRHEHAKARKKGMRTKGLQKRDRKQNEIFMQTLSDLVKNVQ